MFIIYCKSLIECKIVFVRIKNVFKIEDFNLDYYLFAGLRGLALKCFYWLGPDLSKVKGIPELYLFSMPELLSVGASSCMQIRLSPKEICELFFDVLIIFSDRLPRTFNES